MKFSVKRKSEWVKLEWSEMSEAEQVLFSAPSINYLVQRGRWEKDTVSVKWADMTDEEKVKYADHHRKVETVEWDAISKAVV